VSREHPTIAPAIIACIKENRDPNVRELFEAADWIEADLVGGNVTAGSFGSGRSIRLFSMRVALAATRGEPCQLHHRSAGGPTDLTCEVRRPPNPSGHDEREGARSGAAL
jgi:hypothetical protein